MQRIGELAAELETTPKTLRLYEELGLLSAPDRTAAGYRVYNEPAVARARLVLGLRRIGLSIDEVRALVQVDDSGTTLRQRLLAVLSEKLRQMDVALAVQQGRREDLNARYDALLATPRDRVGECVCGALMSSCCCGRRAA